MTLEDGITPVAGAMIIGGATSPLTDINGDYTLNAITGTTVWISASKANYMTVFPVDGTYEVTVGTDPITGKDFKLIEVNNITGIVKDTSDNPIYNAVVQIGGVGGLAVITGIDGKYKITGITPGPGLEVYADALGYADNTQTVDATPASYGPFILDITLTAKTEMGVIKNGGLEQWGGSLPVDWINFQDPNMTATQSSDAFSGSYCAFVTATAQYAFLMASVDVIPGSSYNCYFKLKADTGVTQCFPMPAFRNNAGDEILPMASEEPGYIGWRFNPPKTWTQFLKFDVSGIPMPLVRVAAPANATKMTVIFGYDAIPALGKGIYVDDVVIDRVGPDAIPVANLADLRSQPIGKVVYLTETVTVTLAARNLDGTRTNNYFYVGEAQARPCLKVVDKVGGSDNLYFADKVTNLIGTVRNDAGGVYLELSADPTGVAGTAIKPVGVNNKAVAADSNLDLRYVRVWGGKAHVTKTDSEGNVIEFTISDGYNAPITVHDPSGTLGKTADVEGGIFTIDGVLIDGEIWISFGYLL
ncbi:MAG: hypothetical protein NT018_09190 [Armatimonadetes bacterium]|nr:hypothetical protein [Armatimonadota bacterium]